MRKAAGKMRTPLNLDDQLLAEAQKYTGIAEKTLLVREALSAKPANGLSSWVAAIRTPNFASGDGVAGMIVVDSSIWIDHIRSSDRDAE